MMVLNLKKKQLYFRTLLLLPGVLFCLILFMFFFSDAFRTSMHEFKYGLMGNFIGFDNYRYILGSEKFIQSLVNNLVYTAGVVAISFIIGFAMALLVTTKVLRKRSYFRAFLTIPMLCIPAASALLWRLLYSSEFGVLKQFLSLLGLDYTSLLANPRTSLFAVMAADIWAWTPYMFLILVAGLESIPQESYEAARIDGASSVGQFFYITLPLSKYIILISLCLKTLDTYRNFVYVWVMTNGGPGHSSEVLSTMIYRTAFQNFDFGEGTAMGVITFFVAFPLIMLFVIVMKSNTRESAE